jgi:hypothetical protein
MSNVRPSRNTMPPIPSYKALLKFYEAQSAEIQGHFEHLPKLVNDDLPYVIALAYCFLKIEQAQNRALYGGVVKVHRCNAEFVRRLMNFQHLTRDGFRDLFKNVFGKPLKDSTTEAILEAEKVRDKVIHGKDVSQNELREAIAGVLAYAEAFNAQVQILGDFKPMGDMRGFKGRAEALDKRTTKWLMRGLGFGVKA